jgi:uncharacterized RDD family membrane protein YckC
MEATSQDLITGALEEHQFVHANSGKRLANFLIDRVVFMGLALIVGILLGIFYPESVSGLEHVNQLLDIIVTYFFYALYMSFIEAVTKGRSIGKFITGTKAVNEDGTDISVGTAFIRSFCRFPIEQLSGLGKPCYPWHDQWSNTYVIDLKNSVLPNSSLYITDENSNTTI